MARADTPTILPLDVYAKIVGVNPLHFNGARLPDITPEPFTTSAPSSTERPLWHQFTWQDTNNISREELAETISQAESDIANFLGYWPAPVWLSQEVHNYPTPNRAEFYGQGFDVRGQLKEIHLNYNKIIQAGRRNTTLIATATIAGGTLVFSDPNTNGWSTLATITVPTTLTDTCEIKLYFIDEGGAQEWEVRPLKSVVIAGGFVTITVDSWLLFDPDVTDAIPTGEITAINASLAASYVSSIEVRREFTDFTQPSAQFFWERDPRRVIPNTFCCTSCAGSGCEVCTLLSQNGCFNIRDVENGRIIPSPATFNTTTEIWEKNAWLECREPDQVKVWYRSGEQSERGLRGECNKLSNTLARQIVILATSRLTCEFRSRTSVSDFVEHWRRVIPESGSTTNTIFTDPSLLRNPFGVTRGEIYAFRQLRQKRGRRVRVAAVAA